MVLYYQSIHAQVSFLVRSSSSCVGFRLLPRDGKISHIIRNSPVFPGISDNTTLNIRVGVTFFTEFGFGPTPDFSVVLIFFPVIEKSPLFALRFFVNNFFGIKANATKLGDFFQNLSGNNLIWHVTAHATWRFHGNHILTSMFFLLKKMKKLRCFYLF